MKINYNIRRSVVLFVLMVFILPCVTAQNKGRIKITLDIFSGRPDPVFIISEDEFLTTFKSLLGEAKKMDLTRAELSLPDGLGYRGMMIENLDRAKGLPDRIMIYRNRMQYMDSSGAMEKSMGYLNDSSGSIEKLILIKMAENKIIPAGLRDIVMENLKK